MGRDIIKRQVHLLNRARKQLFRAAAAMNEVARLETEIQDKDKWLPSPYYLDAVSIAEKAERLADRIEEF